MPATQGINYLGLAVWDLEKSTSFFVDALGWEESGRDDRYARTAVSDGMDRLTLWQVDQSLEIGSFDRRKNVGLHHLALEVVSEDALNEVAVKMNEWPGVEIEFIPELLGEGPRKHMMCCEPGGTRIEFIWPGS